MPRAPASRQRSASRSGSWRGSTRQNATSWPPEAAAWASTRSFAAEYPFGSASGKTTPRPPTRLSPAVSSSMLREEPSGSWPPTWVWVSKSSAPSICATTVSNQGRIIRSAYTSSPFAQTDASWRPIASAPDFFVTTPSHAHRLDAAASLARPRERRTAVIASPRVRDREGDRGGRGCARARASGRRARRRPAVPEERLPRLPEHPAAGRERARQPDAAARLRGGQLEATAAQRRPAADVRRPRARRAEAQGARHRQVLQGRELRRQAGRRGAQLQAARRRHDPA